MMGVRPVCGFGVGKGGSLVGFGERVWGRIPLEPLRNGIDFAK